MDRTPPTLDMTPDGAFRAPPRAPVVPWSVKLIIGAVLVGVIATAIAVAAAAVWVISALLPVIIVAAAVAWGTARYRRWQARRGGRGVWAG